MLLSLLLLWVLGQASSVRLGARRLLIPLKPALKATTALKAAAVQSHATVARTSPKREKLRVLFVLKVRRLPARPDAMGEGRGRFATSYMLHGSLSHTGSYCAVGSKEPIKCPVGFYCPAGTEHEFQYPCPQGTYGKSEGATSADACQPCEGGQLCYAPGTGITGSNAMAPCPPGGSSRGLNSSGGYKQGQARNDKLPSLPQGTLSSAAS